MSRSRARLRAALLLAAAWLGLGPRTAAAQPAAAAGAASPLVSAEALIELAVPGHQPSVVSLPLGSVGPRPVVVVTHGNYDRPEWECEIWRKIVGNKAFVVCPRGELRPETAHLDYPRYRYRNNQALEREIDAALGALRQRFGVRVQAVPHVYVGFSQGAIMGPPIVARRPRDFRRVVLLEGGAAQWTAARVRAFASAGPAAAPGELGGRVLFVCGQPGCAAVSRRAGRLLEARGAKTRVLYGKNVGHFNADRVTEQVFGNLEWIVEGDPRW